MCLSKNNNVVNKSSTKSSLISAKRVVSWEELNSKNTVDECWIGYRGKVYDVTRWLAKHPGGLRSIMSTAGKDATSVMISLHAPETLAKHMKRIRQVGILPKERLTAASSSTECTEQALVELKQQQMEDDFAQLHDFFDREGWYERIMWPYAFVFMRIALLWTLGLYGMKRGAESDNYGWTCLGSACLGFFFQNVAFVGHDIGHGSVTMCIAVDSWLGLVIGNLWTGIDMTWWKSTHYVHHSATNALDDDPDIQHSPIFCFDPGFEAGRFSTYHGRFLPQCIAFLVKRQHLYFHIVMAFARFNLYIQSILHLIQTCPFRTTTTNATNTTTSTTVTDTLTGETRTKYAWHKPPAHHWLASVISLTGFYAFYINFFLSLNNLPHTALALLLSHAVAGILHVQILLSHVAMDYCNSGPGHSQNVGYYQWQALSTMDIACHPIMDWFHGGLQFQLEHHMFPRLPRWRLRKAIPHVDEIFHKYNIVQPVRIPFLTANLQVLSHLKQVGEQVASCLNKQT